MRVMVVGSTNPDTFADNVIDTLQRMGHSVLGVGEPLNRLFTGSLLPEHLSRLNSVHAIAGEKIPRLNARRQASLIADVARFKPDLLLTVDRRLQKAVIQAAREQGVPAALWFPDHVSSMGRHDMFLNGYERIYLKNPELVDRLSGIYGLPVRYLPEACNPHWHRPIGEYGTQPSVVMAGNVHPTRAALLSRLVQDGVPLKLYGAPVPKWVGFPELRLREAGEHVERERKSMVFRSARVVLNNLHPAEFAGVNCRLFEATGCGALVLTEAREGLDDCFTVGTEVDVFADYEELLAKIRGYLADPLAGREMADAAARRSQAEHTYEARLLVMFDDLGLV